MNKIYKLSDCTELIYRGIKIIKDEDGIDCYELNMKNFNGKSFKLDGAEKIKANKKQISLRKLEKGDIIMPIRIPSIKKLVNENKFELRFAIFDLDTDLPCFVNHQYFIIRPNKSLVTSYFILIFLLSDDTAFRLTRDKEGAFLKDIKINFLEELELEVPELTIQDKAYDAYLMLQEFNKFRSTTIGFGNLLNGSLFENLNNPTLSENLNELNKDIDKLTKSYTKFLSENEI